MKIAAIKDAICDKPIWNGEPCIYIEEHNGQDVDKNKFYLEIKAKRSTLIYLKIKNLEANPDLRTFIIDFSRAGYRFIVDMPATNCIDSLRNVKNISFLLGIDVGKDEQGRKDYKYLPRNLQLMKENDGFVFTAKEEDDILDFIAFFRNKMIHKPFLIMELKKPMLQRFFAELKRFQFRILVSV